MSSPAQEEITSLVSSVFAVREIRQNLDALQFEVEEEGFKEKFVLYYHPGKSKCNDKKKKALFPIFS